MYLIMYYCNMENCQRKDFACTVWLLPTNSHNITNIKTFTIGNMYSIPLVYKSIQSTTIIIICFTYVHLAYLSRYNINRIPFHACRQGSHFLKDSSWYSAGRIHGVTGCGIPPWCWRLLIGGGAAFSGARKQRKSGGRFFTVKGEMRELAVHA